MPKDYDEASRTYDQTRDFDPIVVDALARGAGLRPQSQVLDFGCGTGNYLGELRRRYVCDCFGVDPSAGMRRAATRKHPDLHIRDGDHRHIPFNEASFDLIYMTDVLHHVPDLCQLFGELQRCLKPEGMICIATESHTQIAARFYNAYFPSLCDSEIRRYPTIESVADVATRQTFAAPRVEVLANQLERCVDEDLIAAVSAKSFSMFDGISELEFQEGLASLIADKGRKFHPRGEGVTLVWFRRAFE